MLQPAPCNFSRLDRGVTRIVTSCTSPTFVTARCSYGAVNLGKWCHMTKRGPVFQNIDRELRQYNICIENHVADESLEGELETRLNVPNPRFTIGQRRPGTIVEGTTTLVGITFRPKNFQKPDDGVPPCHSQRNAGFSLSPADHRQHGKTDLQGSHSRRSGADLVCRHFSWMPGKKEMRAFGFREIKDLTPQLDDRPLMMSDVRPNPTLRRTFFNSHRATH